MGRTVVVVLVAVLALVAATNTHCTLLNQLRSSTFPSYPFIYDAWKHAGVMLAPALKMLSLLKHIIAGTGYEALHRAVGLELAAPMCSETSGLPAHKIPDTVVQNMISILYEYHATTGFSKRFQAERESAKEAGTFGRIFDASTWPVALDPPAPGVYEFKQQPVGAGFNKVPPTRGFIRRPRMDGIGKLPREVYGTLEMIQRFDADGCLLRLCCEMGAEPMRYRRYQLRMSLFLLHLRSLDGECRTVSRRHEAAIEMGRFQFRGNSTMCAVVFDECS